VMFVSLVQAGPVELIDGPRLVTAGVSVEEAPGHTPGHLLVRVTSGDSGVLIIGDITHHPLQVSHPDWNSAGWMCPHGRRRLDGCWRSVGLMGHGGLSGLAHWGAFSAGADETRCREGATLAGTSAGRVG